MADDLGLIAWSFLPENVQVLYLQKIAQMRKKYLRPQIINDTDEAYFLHEVQFSAAIEAAHFPAETTRPLGPRLSAIFAFFYKFSNSLILDNKNEFVMGPDGYYAKLFSSSKVEDFFSSVVLAHP